MSPEQALAKHGLVDHRTDVYSLGVTLYELLTGTPAVGGKDREQILNAITLDEPRPPRTVDGAIPHELETIVLRAIGKEPDARYSTARDLAADLKNFLDHKPIRARRPTAWQILRKWSRRHSTVLTTAGVMLLLSALALTGSVMAYNARLRHEVVRADAAEVEARAQKTQADRNYRQARQTVARMLGRLNDKDFAQVPRLSELRKSQHDDALQFYQAIIEQADNPDPVVQFDVAQAYMNAGAVQFSMSSPVRARENYERARALLERLRASDPDNADYRRILSQCRETLGHISQNQGHAPEEALGHYRAALDLREELSRASPDDPVLFKAVAIASLNLGNACSAAGQVEEARLFWEKARHVSRLLLQNHPKIAGDRFALAACAINLGDSYASDGLVAEAESAYQDGVKLLEECVREHPEDNYWLAGLGETYGSQAALLVGRRPLTEIIGSYARPMGMLRELHEREPGFLAGRQMLMGLIRHRALAFGLAHEETKARADWAWAAKLAENSDDPRTRLLGAVALAHLGNYEQAAKQIEAAKVMDDWFTQALGYAACARAADRDQRLSDTERKRKAIAFADTAMTLLGKARAARAISSPEAMMLLKEDDDFALLRTRTDFRSLVSEVVRAGESKKVQGSPNALAGHEK
jgi:tetratricopeptide (TPR) repeat protein